MSQSDSQQHFQSLYQDHPPWDAGKPQPPFVRVADQISGTVLDAGCGTGENALFFAARGLSVVGMDFIEAPLSLAREKAATRSVDIEFLVADATKLIEMNRVFDVVLDCGLFHVFSDEDRTKYVAGLRHVTKPNGTIYLMCFSDEEPPGRGPRRIAQNEIRDAFADGWTVERIEAAQFEVNPNAEQLQFSDGGPKAWFATIRRTA